MARHFKHGGCGVRLILDIPVFVKRFANDIDWKYVRAELNKLRLFDFASNIFSLCELWFCMKTPFDCTVSNDELDLLGAYVIDGGVFGYENKNLDAIRINKSDVSVFGRIANILKLIFPSSGHLKKRYVWAENMPSWLLPMGWIKFWWFRLVQNKENSLKRIKLAFESNEDALEHTKLMKLIGLDNE
jgi:hypothetical protein